MPQESQSFTFTDPVAQCVWALKEEARTARQIRMLRNQENFDCYHLHQDYSHKQKGQSKEFLAKQSIATEQLASFLQQGLMDLGEWFRILPELGVDPNNLKIKPETMQKLCLRQLDKNNFGNFFNDTLKFGLLGSLMIVKVTGKKVKKADYEIRIDSQSDTPIGAMASLLPKQKLVRKEKDIWQLKLTLVRQEDFFPDPTGDGLYEIERMEMDWHELWQTAKANPGIYDLDVIERMQASGDDLQKAKKARETNQNVTYSGYRKRIELWQFWGTLIEQATGKVLKENCVTTIDSQGNVIEPPREIPFWHKESPYVTAPIIRVPRSVWHRALMDAATRHNVALNELYNLMVDGAMMDVHGIKQIRPQWLEDPDQVADGIPPGITLNANSQCPPGAKVLERVDTSSLTPEAMNMSNFMDREFQQSAFTNDTRLGNIPQRAVKATEVVASNQSLTGVMNGIVKDIESGFVSPLLRKVWLLTAQESNDLNTDEVKALVGEQQATYLASLSQERLFKDTYSGYAYQTYGLSATLNKIQDFRKITTLLQSIGNSPDMMNEFRKKYSFPKLLGEIMKSLDIDEEKIKASDEEIKQADMERQMMQQAQLAKASGNTQGGEGTNPQSQIPQMANSSKEEGMSVQRGANNVGMTHP